MADIWSEEAVETAVNAFNGPGTTRDGMRRALSAATSVLEQDREGLVKRLSLIADTITHTLREFPGRTPLEVDADDVIRQAALALAAVGQASSRAERDVLAERRRQITEEGWTPEHDDQHSGGELALAAAAYASHSAAFAIADERSYRIKAHHPSWPWDRKWWKPKDRRRDLERAGALILAEIERLDRKAAPPATGGER